MLQGLEGYGLPLTRHDFRLQSNSGVAGWEMVRQGLAIGVMWSEIAELAPEVEALLPELVAIEFPVWLTTHRELHSSRRIRLVFDLLADALGDG